MNDIQNMHRQRRNRQYGKKQIKNDLFPQQKNTHLCKWSSKPQKSDWLFFNIFFVRCWRFYGLRSRYKLFDHVPLAITVRLSAALNNLGSAINSIRAARNQRQLRWDKADWNSFYSHTYDHLSAVNTAVSQNFLEPYVCPNGLVTHVGHQRLWISDSQTNERLSSWRSCWPVYCAQVNSASYPLRDGK